MRFLDFLDQTFLGLGLGRLFPARESLVCDFPARDWNIAKPFFTVYTPHRRLKLWPLISSIVHALNCMYMSLPHFPYLNYLRRYVSCGPSNQGKMIKGDIHPFCRRKNLLLPTADLEPKTPFLVSHFFLFGGEML